MSYTSFSYLLFFLGITYVLYTLFPKKYKYIVLLCMSYLFYIVSSSWLIVFLVLTTFIIYFSAIWIDKINNIFIDVKKNLNRDEKKNLKNKLLWQKKAVVCVMLFFCLGALIFLKYYNLFSEILNFVIFQHIHLELPYLKLLLPLGISFYTLQAISYVIDVYRGKYKADYCLPRVALYLVFFPTIVEGPIGRYDEYAYQLYEGHSFHYENLTFGCQLILWGLFKKLVIADRANLFVNVVFKSPQDYAGFAVIFSIIFYTIQIYTEFSGCMDIVRGSAQIFSVHLPQNFKQPFFSKSINEFWQRWHMTLGTWLRDYVFYSVSLSQPFKKFNQLVKNHCNGYLSKLLPATTALFFVWICNGLWHGASIKYIVYGMYYYVLMVLGMFLEPVFIKVMKTFHIHKETQFFRVFQIIRTCILVNIGMLIFRAKDLTTAWNMFLSCFRDFSLQPLSSYGLRLSDLLMIVCGVVIVFIVGVLKEKGVSIRETIAKRNIVLRWTVYFAALFIVIILGAYGRGYDAVSFIYAQF